MVELLGMTHMQIDDVFLTGRYAGRPVHADGGTRLTSRVFIAHAGRWPHLTARTPVTSLHNPDRFLFTKLAPLIL